MRHPDGQPMLGTSTTVAAAALPTPGPPTFRAGDPAGSARVMTLLWILVVVVLVLVIARAV